MEFAMGQAIPLRNDYTADQLRCLARQAKDVSQARRLLAIAAVLDGASRAEAARIGGMDRQTLRDWVIRFGSRSHGGVQKNFPARVAEVRQQLTSGTPVEVWFQDEMRVGQKNKLTYRWARKGSRPRATHDQRTQSTYLFGAVCPEHGTGAALVLPVCNSEAMQLHLNAIAGKVSPGAHAIVILDQAGWHGAKISECQPTSPFCRCHRGHPS